jgi:hypothetical protein
MERFGILKILSPAAASWNMTGIPNRLHDFRKVAVYPGVDANQIQIYNNGYEPAPDPLDNFRGYWVNFPSARTVTYLGAPVYSSSMEVDSQWNIIGSISQAVDAASVVQDPPNNVISQYFKYDNGYVPVDILEPGRGHWVKVLYPGTLTLQASPPKVQVAEDLFGQVQSSV